MNTLAKALQKVADKERDPAIIRSPSSRSKPSFIDLGRKPEACSDESDLSSEESDDEDSSVEAERGNVDGSSSDPNLGTIDTGNSWDVTAPSSQGKESTAPSEDKEMYRIPEPDWYADTVFFVFACLQTGAANQAEFDLFAQKSREIKKLMFASKRRARIKARLKPVVESKIEEPRPATAVLYGALVMLWFVIMFLDMYVQGGGCGC